MVHRGGRSDSMVRLQYHEPTARLPLNRPDRVCHPHHPIPSHDARYAPRTTPPCTDIACGPQLTAHNAQLTSTSPHYQVSGANLTTITFIMRHCGIAIAGYLVHDATRMIANWLNRTPLMSSVLYCHRTQLKAREECLRAAVVREPKVASNYYNLANILLERDEYASAMASYLNAMVVCAGALRLEAKSHWRLWWLHRNREDDWADSFFQ